MKLQKIIERLNFNLILSLCAGLVLLSPLATSELVLAQQDETIDLGSLRAQLETSRSQSGGEADLSTLEQKKKLLQEEEDALMNKFKDSAAKENAKEKEGSRKESNLLLDESAGLPQAENAKPKIKDEANPLIAAAPTATKKVVTPEAEDIITTSKSIATESNNKIDQAKSNKNTAELQKKVVELQNKINSKSKELEETRNRLVIAETQVERLSGILEKINKQKLTGYLGSASKDTTVAASQSDTASSPLKANQASFNNQNSGSGQKGGEETLVGIVTSQKAFLRSGPSKDDSPLMSVSKGTRLVVETRHNQWFRVITPTGGRAWIATEMLTFGPNSQSGGSPSASNSALRIGGYESGSR